MSSYPSPPKTLCGCEPITHGLYRGGLSDQSFSPLCFDAVVHCTNPTFDLHVGINDDRTVYFHMDDLNDMHVLIPKVRAMATHVLAGRKVAVACAAGFQRSGIFCILVLVAMGFDYDTAYRMVAASWRGAPKGDMTSLLKPVATYIHGCAA